MSRATTTFADVLRHLRTVASLSQEDLAERAGLSLRGVSDLERGLRRAPHLTTVRMLADALELGPDDRKALLTAARPRSLSKTEDAAPASYPPLPMPLTSLIGREQELTDLTVLLGQANVRLVTVTGPGGTGKTRLALEVGAHLQGTFRDGVLFVDLAPVREAEFVLPTLASTLGVRERAGQPLRDTLARVLASKHLLLLLDNCEQVPEAAPEIAALLAACPQLSVLATSRAALRVRGEREVPLLPLPLPASDHRSSVADVALVPTVALFLERATASQPTFALTPDNAAAVAAICQRLDGLPLAIELAAAWTRVLPPAALLDRLEQRLLLLTGGSRDLPARQQTMRDAIAWSYDLLAESEQTLFRRLAVFAGSFSLEAATAVAGARGMPDGAILEGIAGLVTTSLLQTREDLDGGPRYQMLETIREYGLEQLAASGEAEELGRHHADYALALAQAGAAALGSATQGGWLTRLEVEQANLRAALTWLRDHEAGETGLRLATALGVFWHIRNAHAEARTWLEIFLAHASAATPTKDRLSALHWVGEFAGLLGDTAAAEVHLTESLTLARQVDDKGGIALALRAIGSAAFLHGDVAASIAPFTEAAGIARELEDRRQTAFLVAFLAIAVGHQGDLTRAEALVIESEALLRALGDTDSFEADFALIVHGFLAIMGGDYAQAQPHLEAAVGTGRAIGAKANLSVALGGLADVALAQGDIEAAVQHSREGLVTGWEGNFPLGVAFNLIGLVRLGSDGREQVPVARMVGMVDGVGRAVQVLPTATITAYESSVASVRAALGDAAFTAARAAGRALSLESAVTEALVLADEVTGTGTHSIRPGHLISDGTC
jgi:predicted ATPase/DNA-binding XRE family transcriptional regulator